MGGAAFLWICPRVKCIFFAFGHAFGLWLAYLRGVFNVNQYGVEWTPLGDGVAFVRAYVGGLQIECTMSSEAAQTVKPWELL